jgi:hypothetical protein
MVARNQSNRAQIEKRREMAARDDRAGLNISGAVNWPVTKVLADGKIEWFQRFGVAIVTP